MINADFQSIIRQKDKFNKHDKTNILEYNGIDKKHK